MGSIGPFALTALIESFASIEAGRHLPLAAGTLVLAVVNIGLLLPDRSALRETTLLYAWGWRLASIAAAAVAGFLVLADSPELKLGGLPPGRFAAGALALCPAMAVLGAKRPQHGAWQFVVISLWGVLCLPAAEAAVLRPGDVVQLSHGRDFFLWGLMAIGACNWIGTRMAIPAAFVLLAQCLLLAEYLPGVAWSPGAWRYMAAQGAFLLAIGAERLTRSAHAKASPLDRQWLAFRDAFGLLWALRVAERANAFAAGEQVPVYLGWRGFFAVSVAVAVPPAEDGGRSPKDAAGQLPDSRPSSQVDEDSLPPGYLQNLHNLWGKFVSPKWLNDISRQE